MHWDPSFLPWLVSRQFVLVSRYPFVVVSRYPFVLNKHIIKSPLTPESSVSQPPAEVCLTDLAWDYPGV